MKDHNYITISGWMIKLGISGNDLLIYALIYGFSQDGENWFQGSLQYIQKWASVSRSTAIRSLEKLVSEGLVLKETEMKNGVSFNKYRADLEVVSKRNGGFHFDNGGGIKMTPGGGIKMTPNNTSKDITINNLIYTADQASEIFNENGVRGNFIKKMCEMYSVNSLSVNDQLKKWVAYNEGKTFNSKEFLENSFNNWMRNYKPEKKSSTKNSNSGIDWDELKREMS